MKTWIRNLTIIGLCMGTGIAASAASELTRSTRTIDSGQELPRGCPLDENGHAVDELPSGQLGRIAQQGAQVGGSVCGPDGWSHPVTGPARMRSGSVPARPGPGEPVEEKVDPNPGALDRSWYRSETTLDKPSTGRNRRNRSEDEEPCVGEPEECGN